MTHAKIEDKQNRKPSSLLWLEDVRIGGVGAGRNISLKEEPGTRL